MEVGVGAIHYYPRMRTDMRKMFKKILTINILLLLIQVNYLLMVALASGELCIYRDLSMIHSFKVDAPVAALCYGTYGREENALIAVHGQVSAIK